jgi:hypothetical protein
MKQMRGRVIPHGRLANVNVDDGIDFVADSQTTVGAPFLARTLREKWGFDDNLMRPHSLNRRIASSYVGNDGIVIVRVKPSLVAYLPAGFGIERRVIKNDLARFASLEFPRSSEIFDDR